MITVSVVSSGAAKLLVKSAKLKSTLTFAVEVSTLHIFFVFFFLQMFNFSLTMLWVRGSIQSELVFIIQNSLFTICQIGRMAKDGFDLTEHYPPTIF